MSNLQNLVNNWLLGNGFTVGVQDIIATPETLAKIEVNLKSHKKKVRQIIRSARQGKLETIPGKGMLDSFEVAVNTELRAALDEAGKAALEDLAPWNRLKNMVTAGSKGGNFNISQIMACVGQQNVNGMRITFGFARRSLPHFSKDDYGPESKGFVSSCYV
jgi:DNA-directed RNA polymerase II subunit RPB1